MSFRKNGYSHDFVNNRTNCVLSVELKCPPKAHLPYMIGESYNQTHQL